MNPLQKRASSTKGPAKMSGGEPPAAKRRLAYGEKRDLELLPAKIEKLESEIAGLHDEMAQPDYYSQPASELARVQEKLKQLTEQLTTAYKRLGRARTTRRLTSYPLSS